MIEVKSLIKNYQNNNVFVEALKGVTFNLPDRGLVFILGKSGSGKSTLLNLIGGLDGITSGDIVIDGRSLKNFKKSEYDSYRNNYIGFIFQDFNLIDNISIYENIQLALSFQGIISNNLIHNTLSDVGLGEIEDRKPKELSGGQQQRIAIARALVKNSKIILADEPTGNLDSETGDQIFNLLQKLSKERLIIVVSHDREYANKFGNRIIELQDGIIISDYEKKLIPTNNNKQYYTEKTKTKLSNRFFLNLSFSNIKTKLWRTSFSIILLTLATLLTVSSMIMGFYSTEKAIFSTINKNQDDYIYFYDSNKDYYGEVTKSLNHINRKLVDELLVDQTYISRTNTIVQGITGDGISTYSLCPVGYINTIHDLDNFGFVFYEGTQEINSDSIIVSDFYIDNLIYKNKISTNIKYFIMNGTEEIILDKNIPYKEIIGRQINNYSLDFFNQKQYGTPFQIAAIYKTEYKLYEDEKFVKLKSITQSEYDNWLNKKNHIYLTYEIKKDYDVNEHLDDIGLNTNDFNEKNYKLDLFQDNTIINLKNNLKILGINTQDLSNIERNRILTQNGFIDDDYILKDNEIIINLDMYNQLFNKANNEDYYISDGEIINIPEYIGENLTYKIYDNDYKKYVLESKFKIIGVDISTSPSYYLPSPKIYINVTNRGNIQELLDNTYHVISLYLGRNHDDLSAVINKYSASNLYPVFNFSSNFYSYEVGIKQMQTIMLIIGSGLLFISFLLITNLILISVTSNKKEVGILKALGGSNKTVYKIYLTESLFIGFSCLIISLAFFPFLTLFLNKILCPKDYINLQFFNENIIEIWFILISTIIIPFSATILSIRKIVKMTPMNSIRNT